MQQMVVILIDIIIVIYFQFQLSIKFIINARQLANNEIKKIVNYNYYLQCEVLISRALETALNFAGFLPSCKKIIGCHTKSKSGVVYTTLYILQYKSPEVTHNNIFTIIRLSFETLAKKQQIKTVVIGKLISHYNADFH